MTDDIKTGGRSLDCSQFDALLADAIDGTLSAAQMATFTAHAHDCAACGPLFTQARAGLNWMRSLEPVEPPANLVHNILAATSMQEERAPAAEQRHGWWLRVADFVAPSLAPALRGVMQPRPAMTLAMAFFSISMVLNFTGVRVSDLKYLDLRPSAITTAASVQYHQTTGKMVKYFENIRLYYEWESRVKSLQEQRGDEGAGQDEEKQESKPAPGNNETRRKKQEEREQNQNYVQQRGEVVLAVLTGPERAGGWNRRQA
jgi:hypothetical protein